MGQVMTRNILSVCSLLGLGHLEESLKLLELLRPARVVLPEP